MTDENSQMKGERRTFLKTVGMLGAAATVGSATAGSVLADSHLDEYHQTLRSDLTGRGGNRTLPAGTFLFGGTEQAALDAFSLVGGGSASSISVDTDAVPITQAAQLEVSSEPANPYDISYQGFLEQASLSQGDILLGVAYLRSDTDDAQVRAGVTYRYRESGGNWQYPGGNFVKESKLDEDSAVVEPSDKWMRYFFPVVVGEKPGPSGAEHQPYMEFWTGYTDQTIEIGGIALIDYSGTDVSVGTLPPYDYQGRSKNADWRQAAQDRIEQYRKTNFDVEVVDGDGNAVSGASVNVQMREHAFDFGTAVSMEHINGDSEDDQRYKEIVKNKFNKAVIENGLKYPQFLGPWDDSKKDAKQTLEWLNDHNIPTRGHYLLWEQFNAGGGGGMAIQNPGEMSGQKLSDLITERITNHASDVGDMVTEWDMHNHPVWQPNFRDDDDDGLSWKDVDRWWQAANEATEQPLYTNEMGQVGGTWQQSGYLDFLDHLVENDYPIDGIGFMGHHQQKWNQMMDMSRLEGVYDLYRDRYNLPILITEFDIQIFSRRNAQDVSVQTDYTRDFLTMTFSKPNVEGVMSWGFWEEDHWRPTGAYYNSDWSLRPNGETYFDLVYNQWWTDESGETDADGMYSTDGFKGDYAIFATADDKAGVSFVSIDDDTSTITIELESLSGIQGAPTDTDGDSTMEDVSGDGEATVSDVQALFENLDSQTIQNNADAFDFNDDGEVSVSDVVALFREIV